MTFDWDRYANAEDRWKPETVGDATAGVVRALRTTTFGGKLAEADAVPELLIEREDGSLVSVAASQVRLRTLLAEARPAPGDRIAIVFTGERPASQAGFSPVKQFDVVVRRDESGVSAPSGASAPPPSGVSAADLLPS
jgi:hypothetical protein